MIDQSKIGRLGNSEPESRAGLSMIELLVAVGLLVFAMSSFVMAIHGLNRLESRYEQENRALVVLANVLERIEAGGRLEDGNKVCRISEGEFKNSELAGVPGLAVDCGTESGATKVRILAPCGKGIAGIEMKR